MAHFSMEKWIATVAGKIETTTHLLKASLFPGKVMVRVTVAPQRWRSTSARRPFVRSLFHGKVNGCSERVGDHISVPNPQLHLRSNGC